MANKKPTTKKIIKTKRVPPHLDYSLGDPEPTSDGERMEYAGRVNGFFIDILNKKIQYMISLQYQELADPTHSKDMDMFIKGTINGLSLLLDWGEEKAGEYQQYKNSNAPNEGDAGGDIIN